MAENLDEFNEIMLSSGERSPLESFRGAKQYLPGTAGVADIIQRFPRIPMADIAPMLAQIAGGPDLDDAVYEIPFPKQTLYVHVKRESFVWGRKLVKANPEPNLQK